MRVPTRRSENYPRPKLDPYITEQKYLEIKNKLELLKKVSRLHSMKEVATLAEMGDLSENAAYQIAKGKLRGINQHILELEYQIKKAIIIQPLKTSRTVQLGSRVTIENKGKQKTYLVLGSSEVDPIRNIISHNSPLGACLIGKGEGEVVSFRLKDSEVTITIISIQ